MLNVELRDIDSIKPYDRNPRRNDAAVEHVTRSIKLYGLRLPIVVDKDSVVVVGHTRLKAVQSLGLTQVPVHVAMDLSPEQAKAYRLADKEARTWSVKHIRGGRGSSPPSCPPRSSGSLRPGRRT